MRKNVLVFPCGSEIGLEVYRSLRYSTHFDVYGGSSTDDHGMFVYERYIPGMPRVSDANFVAELNAVIEAHDIAFVVPAHDDVVVRLAQAKEQGELSCDVVGSPYETTVMTRSKARTYAAFDGVIPTPLSYADAASVPDEAFPVFLKPDVGQGSKGTHKARSRQEVEFYVERDPSLLVLEYLPGPEYTVDCFTNKDGQLLFCEGRGRVRISNGISVSSRSVTDDRFVSLAARINDRLVFRGAWFFQVKERADGELVLMEIAPRIAGTMGLVRSRGVNMALLSLFDALGMPVAATANDYSIVIDRALENRYAHDISYSHVYLDFDDLVIVDGKVSPAVMAFVFQCINKGVRVHLLTRHKDDIHESLAKYRLTSVFDEVIHVTGGREKYQFIDEDDAIFIDDSFAERHVIRERCGIPVFDGHMIEALMEKGA